MNCSAPQYVESLLGAAAAATAKSLFAYPNSGESWDACDGAWHGENRAADLASYAQRWLKAGARMLGRCCRTGPEDIRKLAGAMRAQG